MNLTKAFLALAILAGGAFAHAEATCQAKADSNFNSAPKQKVAEQRADQALGQSSSQPAPTSDSAASSAR